MGSTNLGNQTLTFDFKQEGTSEGFNKIMYNLIPKGIIRGGELTKLTDSTVSISPFLCFFEDTSVETGTRLETSSDVSVSVSQANNYIVGRFNWLNIEDNYMDFLGVSSSNIQPTDLIFGRAIYDTLGVLQNFDVSEKSWSREYYENFKSDYPNFHVMYNPTDSSKIIINKGSAFINGNLVTLSSPYVLQYSDLNITNSRKDLVVIDESSSISIIKGDDSVTPTVPKCPQNKLILAVITLPSNPSTIEGTYIQNIYSSNPSLNSELVDGVVVTSKIADSAVTESKLASDSVTTSKIADGNVTNDKLEDSTILIGKLADATKASLQTYGYYNTEDYSASTASSITYNVSLPDATLVQGMTLKITFENALQSNNANGITSVYLKLNNGTAKRIVARRAGIASTDTGYVTTNLYALRSHEFAGGNYSSTYKYKVFDAFTTMTLMYTGTYWLIMENPVLCNYMNASNGYTIYADGLIEQWQTYIASQANVVTACNLFVEYSNTRYFVAVTEDNCEDAPNSISTRKATALIVQNKTESTFDVLHYEYYLSSLHIGVMCIGY